MGRKTKIRTMDDDLRATSVSAERFDHERAATALKIRTLRSPHLIDLKPRAPETADVGTADPRKRKRLPAKWRILLDERIHLREMGVRSVSVKPRGWKDLPPDNAKTVIHAVRITVSRFFNEHPLADLTVLAVLHTTIVLTWKIALLPFGLLFRGAGKPAEYVSKTAPAPLGLPVAPVAARAARVSTRRKVDTTRTILLPLLFGRHAPRLRGVWGFATIALLIILPLGVYGSYSSLMSVKDTVMSNAIEAASHLEKAGLAAKASDFFGAKEAFAMAEESFYEVREELGPLSGVLAAAGSLLPSSSVSSAGLMLVAGEELSEGGKYITAGLAELDKDTTPADKLRTLNAYLGQALPHLDRATEAITKLSSDAVPAEYRETLEFAKDELPRLTEGVHEAYDITGFLAAVIGSERPQRYLLVFQNDNELRPTGGFIGSFALIDVDRGEIVNMEIPGGGSYDLQGSLTAKLISPRPLHLINPKWEFQDANWSPDFPTSAERLSWFYEKSGGPTVDGVIAVNASVLERLLAVLGPVEMEEYDVTLTAENFIEETQREVEIDFDKEENKPKQILSDLAPILLDRVMDADRDDYMGLMTALYGSFTVKDVQMWFRDATMQNDAVDFGWAGEIKSTPGDYLQVVHTNIAGQKTDAVMAESVDHSTKILADGTAIVTLTIRRTHNGEKGALFSGVRNVDYLRVYVPLGSTLVEADGFEAPDATLFELPEPGYEPDPIIAEREAGEILDRRSGTRSVIENGKTVFSNWVQTDPGETSEMTIIYQLPLNAIEMHEPQDGPLVSLYDSITNGSRGIRLTHTLLVQKQSGSNPLTFTSSVDVPRGYHIIWEDPEHETDELGKETATTELDRDMFFGIVAESAN
ncbi:MAG: DUF4012 domain-containing protein [Patescibacteria group bacterium]|nr:DUF4012 domain-containing protein [Patescibacteria group bacterium]